MKPRSQFRLRTLFVLFFCSAVGLTVGTELPQQTLTALGTVEESSGLNWLYLLLGTGSTAMVLGLVQHIGRLRKIDLQTTGSEKFRSAISFAISWRIAVSIAITSCLITIMLYQQERIELPKRDSWLYYGNVFPDFFWYLCIMVVLASSVARSSTPSHTPRWMTPVLWICAAVIGMKVLTQRTLVHYLVYIAISGVEHHEALRFQREGAYSHHQADGFFFFWLSLAAVCCSIVGTAIVVWLLKEKNVWSARRVMAGSIATVLLGFSLGYSLWYYGWGLPREAPDFVAAGVCGTWLDWIGVALVTLVVVVVGGYQLAVDENTSFECENPNCEATPLFHESLWIVLIFVGVILSHTVGHLQYIFDSQSQFGLGFNDIVDYILKESKPEKSEKERILRAQRPPEPTLADGRRIYYEVCSVCHAAGKLGAPITGDKAVWAPLIRKNVDVLYNNTIKGMGNMPAKGACTTCTNAEVMAAVKYMLQESKTSGDYSLW
jgi:cytochrome c5